MNGKKAWSAVKYLLAAVLLVVIFRTTNLSQIQATVRRVVPAWLVVYAVSYLAMTLLKTSQYHLFTRDRVSYREALRITIWQNALTNFIATGAGIASYLAMYRFEKDVRLSRSGVVFLLTKVADLAAIAGYLLLSLAVLWGRTGRLRLTALVLVVLIGCCLAAGGLLWASRAAVSRWLQQKLQSWEPNRRPRLAGFARKLLFLVQGSRSIPGGQVGTAQLISLAYISLSMLSTFASFRMFSLEIGGWEMVFVASLLQLISLVPVQVLGGLGVTEMSAAFLFSVFGLPSAGVLAVMVGARVVFYGMNLVTLLLLPLARKPRASSPAP